MQFDKSLIKILLSKFEPDVEHYTHFFTNCCSSFCGTDNKPLLRKYLSYLKENDYVIQYKYAYNIHKWQITQAGMDFLELLNSDYFIN
jgi:predicted transcriptional regulator